MRCVNRGNTAIPYLPCLLYFLLKQYARLAILIYCRKIVINKPALLQAEGPLLLACNHPNSFLDGMIITTLFNNPVYSLARGDAFKIEWVNRLLRKLQLLPVYRTSEGVENLGHNYTTFEACRETFQRNGIVLIFSEGRCENEWHLRPLRKGTARLAITSWNRDLPLTVVPTALNYSSFRSFGKEVHLFFGEPVDAQQVLQQESEGKQLLEFNRQLHASLQNMVYEIAPGDRAKVKQTFSMHPKPSLALWLLPGLAGIVLHAPFYLICWLLSKRFYNSGHFDSVQTALLMLLYPVYLLLLFIPCFSMFGWWSLTLLLLMPLLARAAVEVKYQAGW